MCPCYVYQIFPNYEYSDKQTCASTVHINQTPRSVASDFHLRCLTLIHYVFYKYHQAINFYGQIQQTTNVLNYPYISPKISCRLQKLSPIIPTISWTCLNIITSKVSRYGVRIHTVNMAVSKQKLTLSTLSF